MEVFCTACYIVYVHREVLVIHSTSSIWGKAQLWVSLATSWDSLNWLNVELHMVYLEPIHETSSCTVRGSAVFTRVVLPGFFVLAIYANIWNILL